MIPGILGEDDEMLKQKILTFLSGFLGVRAKPLFIDVQHYPHALPQYETGHLERVARIEEIGLRYDGLFFAGNGFHGFGITDCIRRARLAVSGLSFV
jgi:oxygen-dependent protoporphyrinogen oxidase